MAQAKYIPNDAARRQVEAMSAYGIPEWDIARVVGIDPKTLRKYYRLELDTGSVKANTQVAKNLFRMATGEGREAVIAAIFWMKTRAGWREQPHPTAMEAEIGKKEQQQREAVTAAKGTGTAWERILQ